MIRWASVFCVAVATTLFLLASVGHGEEDLYVDRDEVPLDTPRSSFPRPDRDWLFVNLEEEMRRRLKKALFHKDRIRREYETILCKLENRHLDAACWVYQLEASGDPIEETMKEAEEELASRITDFKRLEKKKLRILGQPAVHLIYRGRRKEGKEEELGPPRLFVRLEFQVEETLVRLFLVGPEKKGRALLKAYKAILKGWKPRKKEKSE